jgi:hypothetical protein
MIKRMGMEFRNGQMDHNMKEKGIKICPRETECLPKIMVIL